MTYRASAPFTQEWRHFRFSVADGVATVTFDRPDRLNALTLDVYADLRDLFTELEYRDEVAVVVVRGEGRGFCSGGDVEDIIGRLLDGGDQRDVLEFTRMTGAVVQRMRECPKPIIAALNGVAAGAGAVIALASDFRVLARRASFRFSAVAWNTARRPRTRSRSNRSSSTPSSSERRTRCWATR